MIKSEVSTLINDKKSFVSGGASGSPSKPLNDPGTTKIWQKKHKFYIFTVPIILKVPNTSSPLMKSRNYFCKKTSFLFFFSNFSKKTFSKNLLLKCFQKFPLQRRSLQFIFLFRVIHKLRSRWGPSE
jgi:hypothetical protein